MKSQTSGAFRAHPCGFAQATEQMSFENIKKFKWGSHCRKCCEVLEYLNSQV
jgi:hypothetical protein